MFVRLLFVVFSSLALAACSGSAKLEEAEQQIKAFQGRYNDGDPSGLYNLTGDEFKEVTSLEDMVDLYEVVSTRLGRVESSDQINWRVDVTPAATTTVVLMETQFEQGNGTEIYTFLHADDKLELQGWQVNSDRLTLTAEDLKSIAETGNESVD